MDFSAGMDDFRYFKEVVKKLMFLYFANKPLFDCIFFVIKPIKAQKSRFSSVKSLWRFNIQIFPLLLELSQRLYNVLKAENKAWQHFYTPLPFFQKDVCNKIQIYKIQSYSLKRVSYDMNSIFIIGVKLAQIFLWGNFFFVFIKIMVIFCYIYPFPNDMW